MPNLQSTPTKHHFQSQELWVKGNRLPTAKAIESAEMQCLMRNSWMKDGESEGFRVLKWENASGAITWQVSERISLSSPLAGTPEADIMADSAWRWSMLCAACGQWRVVDLVLGGCKQNLLSRKSKTWNKIHILI